MKTRLDRTLNKEDEYYFSAYEKVYDAFCFSLKIYGGDAVQRKRLIKSCLMRCDKLYSRFHKTGVSTDILRQRTKERIKLVYRMNFSNERW